LEIKSRSKSIFKRAEVYPNGESGGHEVYPNGESRLVWPCSFTRSRPVFKLAECVWSPPPESRCLLSACNGGVLRI